MPVQIKIVRGKQMYKRILAVFIVFISIFYVSGCWNYRELNEIAIVAGAAIDKGEGENRYLLTVEVINPQGGRDAKITPDVMSVEGVTIFDAIRNMIKKMGKRLYWSHCKVFVISEAVAREGIVDVLDMLNRDAEVRADIWLVVSREKMAQEILYGKDKLHSTIAFHINETMRAERSLPSINAVELWQFLKELSEEGISPTLAAATMEKEKDETSPKISGSAVFKKDKMIGWLESKETRSLQFIKGRVSGGYVIALNAGEDTNVTLEISKSKTTHTPVTKGEIISMDINIKIDASIAEVSGKEDVISKDGRMKLKKKAEEVIKRQIEETIKKVQKEYKSDIFGFGSVVQREMPELWKKIKPQWEDIFAQMDTNINVEVEIKHSALTSKPIKVGD